MLEYSFWEHKSSICSNETVADFVKAFSDNIKHLDETLITFDIALLQFYLFDKHEELDSLTVLFQKVPAGLRRDSRKKLMNLATIKALSSRKRYE